VAQYGLSAILVFGSSSRHPVNLLPFKGREVLRPDLENDFRTQQSLLLALIQERRNFADGSHGAIHLDQQIAEVENYIRSYQMIKWYEQQGCGERSAPNRVVEKSDR
jgi:hypothetical protein